MDKLSAADAGDVIAAFLLQTDIKQVSSMVILVTQGEKVGLLTWPPNQRLQQAELLREAANQIDEETGQSIDLALTNQH